MIIGMGDDPTLGEYERLLMSTKTTARRELVLLHPNKNVAPGSTREWLKVSIAQLVKGGPESFLLCRIGLGCTDTPTWNYRYGPRIKTANYA
jgi:hypothetical protein